MSTYKKKQDKRRQQAKRRRDRDRKKKQTLHNNSPRIRRITLSAPRPWEGERTEDRAVFDESARSTLSDELATTAESIHDAIRLAGSSYHDLAVSRVSKIPRRSPFSEWRLFIRGLVHWLSDENDEATIAWNRLEPERRPWRIANAMTAARRLDLYNAAADATQDTSNPNEVNTADAKPTPELGNTLDRQMLANAKLLRQVYIEREPLRIAKEGTAQPEESRDLEIGPKKIRWLKDFATQYQSIEPELVAALKNTALLRATSQCYEDLFEETRTAFSGPAHDKKNNLLAYHFESQFGGDEEPFFKAFVRELKGNKILRPEVRDALMSHAFFQEARCQIALGNRGGFDAFFFSGPDNEDTIQEYFEGATTAYPKNQRAHREYYAWLQRQVEFHRRDKEIKKEYEEDIQSAMVEWAEGVPEDAVPRKWLADYFLKAEELEAAKPHVDWLVASRHQDPIVRATPWKWELLDAMRLCRRKATLSKVPAKLDAAKAIWPSWLSMRWLPYLRAAWLLRSDQIDEYEKQRTEARIQEDIAADSLLDACLMLGAAQRMRVPAAALKPLRAPIDAATKSLSKIPYGELVQLGEFFFDLHRTGMVYPAYRMHGGKFCKELAGRWQKVTKLPSGTIEDPSNIFAILWCLEHRAFNTTYETQMPSFLEHRFSNHPIAAAARIKSVLDVGRRIWVGNYGTDVDILRDAAKQERDAYFRFWFDELAERFDEAAKEESAFNRMPFRNGSGGDDFDPYCDCEYCEEQRRKQARNRS